MFCCCRQLRGPFSVHAQMTPGLSNMGVGSNWSRTAVSASRESCGSRLFAAKLAGVVHDFTHQMFDHSLTDDPSVSESGATGETKKAAQRFSAIGR